MNSDNPISHTERLLSLPNTSLHVKNFLAVRFFDLSGSGRPDSLLTGISHFGLEQPTRLRGRGADARILTNL
jgi:hypothetical protein